MISHRVEIERDVNHLRREYRRLGIERAELRAQILVQELGQFSPATVSAWVRARDLREADARARRLDRGEYSDVH